MDTLLLHHCCAPCSPKVVERLRTEYRIESFWFNPNIHPGDEHEKRLESLLRLASFMELAVHKGNLLSREAWIEQAQLYPDRCTFCYTIRLSETARMAKRLGIGAFSTTLLASPYQKHELIKNLGEQIGESEGATFVSRDFRSTYYEGKNYAYRQGSYMQKYCGCIFSKEERQKISAHK